MRPGTLNVPGIVGFGKAAEICRVELATEASRVVALRDALLNGLSARIPDLHVNGSLEHRLPNNLNVAFPNADPQALRLALDDIAVSFGAACSTGVTSPSHVLVALGTSPDLAMTSVRFGLGRWTTRAEIDYAVEKVTAVVSALRKAANGTGGAR